MNRFVYRILKNSKPSDDSMIALEKLKNKKTPLLNSIVLTAIGLEIEKLDSDGK
jgi:hypothetical protein